MRYFNLLIITIIIFSSCVFSGKPKQAEHEVRANMLETNINAHVQYGDSIMVDTVIGDFRLYYKVSEVVGSSLVAFSCNEVQRIDKSILLNIQTLDTTSVVHKQIINIHSLKRALPEIDNEDYLIDSFYLIEVMQDYVVFETKLCKFGMEKCDVVNLKITKDGKMVYSLQK